ncbi:hypothetical protein FC093_21965 [Ilyomonas limi]|uniref:Uncharacterized protein n=1 Tax=Ilyomonas limi TaxID=2575867 RepID=A0A4U3KUK9_9BACT|nr:hypothetical protein [Ilyomonas limi]TKK64717.1 hypothetical protein FC093_21965 [Ilyomonas limi]
MNLSLTWANFVLITGLCLIGYYIVIGLLYYRKDISLLLKPKEKDRLPVTAKQDLFTTEDANVENKILSNDPASEDILPADDEPPTTPPDVQDFVDEIDAYTQACGAEVSKEELLINFRKILHKYPALINSSLRSVLAGVIATASENNCSIHWREDELNELWDG